MSSEATPASDILWPLRHFVLNSLYQWAMTMDATTVMSMTHDSIKHWSDGEVQDHLDTFYLSDFRGSSRLYAKRDWSCSCHCSILLWWRRSCLLAHARFKTRRIDFTKAVMCGPHLRVYSDDSSWLGYSAGIGIVLDTLNTTSSAALGEGVCCYSFPQEALPLGFKAWGDHATTVSIGRACSKRHAGPCSQYVSVSRPGSNLLPVILVPQYITKQSQRRPMLTESH